MFLQVTPSGQQRRVSYERGGSRPEEELVSQVQERDISPLASTTDESESDSEFEFEQDKQLNDAKIERYNKDN